jgi:PP-loop superfamily ATP-utilizing enzyme
MENADREEIILTLSSEQRKDLFTKIGRHLCRLKVNITTKEAWPLDTCCTRCLLNTGLPGVVILPNGLCNHCDEFEKQVEAGEYSEKKVEAIISEYAKSTGPNCIIAYSGGKDSAAALLIAIEKYKLHPIAILVDNGFIPEEVQEASKDFCAQFGVPLKIRTIEIAESASKSIKGKSQTVPCQSCIRHIFRKMAEACEEYKVRLVIGGHRFPPLSFPLSVCTGHAEHVHFVCASPLLAQRMKESDQIDKIRAAGWKSIDIAGNTSNCRLIGYFEETFYDRFGYNPHIYEVSKEIRAGFYSREQGMHKVEKPILSRTHREEVISKLNLVVQ